MPVYECSLPTCPNQYTDGTPRKRLYCGAHSGHEPKPDPAPNAFNHPVNDAEPPPERKLVDKAYMDLVLLMAFNKCSEDAMRDILVELASNACAIGFRSGKDA